MNNRILIVDDHPAINMAVKLLLASEGFDVIAETDNGADALKMVEALCPSAIILDIGIPAVDGLTVIRQIVAKQLPVKIIVLTGLPPHHLAERCKKMGAHGFINKHNHLSELVSAVRAVRRDEIYFPDLMSPPAQSHRDLHERALLERLSAREFRVMQQLAQGMGNKEIAQYMQLSDKTISTYKTRLLLKLNVASLIELYALAKRNGVV